MIIGVFSRAKRKYAGLPLAPSFAKASVIFFASIEWHGEKTVIFGIVRIRAMSSSLMRATVGADGNTRVRTDDYNFSFVISDRRPNLLPIAPGREHRVRRTKRNFPRGGHSGSDRRQILLGHPDFHKPFRKFLANKFICVDSVKSAHSANYIFIKTPAVSKPSPKPLRIGACSQSSLKIFGLSFNFGFDSCSEFSPISIRPLT